VLGVRHGQYLSVGFIVLNFAWICSGARGCVVFFCGKGDGCLGYVICWSQLDLELSFLGFVKTEQPAGGLIANLGVSRGLGC